MGYPTSIANHILTWNKSGTLNQWDQTTYSYNIKNQLIQKVGNGITTNYYAINHKIHQINIGTNILKFLMIEMNPLKNISNSEIRLNPLCPEDTTKFLMRLFLMFVDSGGDCYGHI